MPCRFAREGKAVAREGEAAARGGKAETLEGEAGGYAARECEAVRLSVLEVLLPAATAAPRASAIHHLILHPASSSSHDEYRSGWEGIRRD
jgi:hypothetical protein